MSEKDEYFTDSHLLPDRGRSVLSPDGKYELSVDEFFTKAGCWNFTRGRVRRAGSTEWICEIRRNYSSFWHCFVNHPNGRDYFLAGEDYQGYSVVELDTGARVDLLPKEAKSGVGFCWASCEADETTLTVEGCYWGAQYEIVEYDFTNPLILPLPEISRRDANPPEDDDDEGDVAQE